MRTGAWLLAIWLVACGPNPPLAGGPSPTASSALATARAERPVLLLEIRTGGSNEPGVTTPAPGGVPFLGPSSAASEGDRIYVYDQANRRLLAYVKGRFESALPIQDGPSIRGARSLMLTETRIYLSLVNDDGRPARDFEIDRRDGRVTRVAFIQGGDAPIYPRPRPEIPLQIGKDASASLGMDGRGYKYEWVAASDCNAFQIAGGCHRIRRLDTGLHQVALGVKPFEISLVDVTVSGDGRVVGLRWLFEGPRIVGVEAYQLLGAAP